MDGKGSAPSDAPDGIDLDYRMVPELGLALPLYGDTQLRHPSHGGNTDSNPVGDSNQPKHLNRSASSLSSGIRKYTERLYPDEDGRRRATVDGVTEFDRWRPAI